MPPTRHTLWTRAKRELRRLGIGSAALAVGLTVITTVFTLVVTAATWFPAMTMGAIALVGAWALGALLG